MREASFLSKNEKKWRKVESILDKDSGISPDESANLFIELSDDLSYAETHYPKSVTTRYLNALTIGIYQLLNKRKRDRFKTIVLFWKRDLPLAIASNHRQLLYSFIFFGISFLIGLVSAKYDETFPRVVLGDTYVDQTQENIDSGDPMAIYKKAESNTMFLAIAQNNLRVSGYVFAAGILFGLGTYYFLFINGVMVGTFQYFFIQRGLFQESFLTIWIHGTIEISCIIIAGAAGITLGSRLLFPGTLPRKSALLIGGREALKMFLGIVPLIIIAAFLESFITRLTDAPTIVRLGVILLSLFFVLWYFVYYPIQVKKRHTP